MLSESSAAAKAANNILTVVYTVRASIREAREARKSLSKQVFNIIHLVDSKMIETRSSESDGRSKITDRVDCHDSLVCPDSLDCPNKFRLP